MMIVGEILSLAGQIWIFWVVPARTLPASTPTISIEGDQDAALACYSTMASTAMAIVNVDDSFCRMEVLQPNLITRILEFVELVDRIQAAHSSKKMRRHVYKHCSSLWIHLDFSALPLNIRSRFNDENLARLLKRINAKSVTRTLSLASCDLVDGSGMSPLRHSPVLETVDLRRNSPDPQHERRATRELRTMVHHALFHVWFSSPSAAAASYSSGIAHFFRVLHAAKLKQALEEKIKCCACGNGVADKAMQLVPSMTGFPPNQCHECKKHYCLGQDCPTKLVVCVSCFGAKCLECDNGTSTICEACAREYCHDCVSFSKCAGCLQVSCGGCFVACSTCHKTFCSHCVENEKSILSCLCCDKQYCFDCRQVLMCFACQQYLCEKCAVVTHCGYCSEDYCSTCRSMVSMHTDTENVPNGTGGRTVDVCVKCQEKMKELL